MKLGIRGGSLLWLTAGLVLALTYTMVMRSGSESVLADVQAQKPLAEPPSGQKFIGSKQCSACHFDQFMAWRGTKHAKGFEILPEKYQSDTSCLKCHSTGFGDDSGFKDIASTPALAGTSCEACHGPGSKHAEIAKTFGEKKLSKEEQDYVRSTIYKMQPKNICVSCHLPQQHKKHPDYQK